MPDKIISGAVAADALICDQVSAFIARLATAIQVGLIVMLLLACCSAPVSPSPPAPIAFSLHYADDANPIEPGSEGIRCLDFDGPAEDTYVSGWHVSKENIHHLNVYLRKPNTAPLYTEPTPCGGGFGPGFFVLDSSKADLDERFGREGAALLIPGGSKLLVDVHFLNAGIDPVLSDAAITFYAAATHTTDVRGVVLMGHVAAVPPGETVTQTFATATNPRNLTLDWISVMAHQHAHGTLETLRIDDKEVYRSTNWADPSNAHPIGVRSTPTSRIEFSCTIANTSGSTLSNGLQLQTAEMCEIFGLVEESGGPAQSWEGKAPPL
jgi:hypothetical protein